MEQEISLNQNLATLTFVIMEDDVLKGVGGSDANAPGVLKAPGANRQPDLSGVKDGLGIPLWNFVKNHTYP